MTTNSFNRLFSLYTRDYAGRLHLISDWNVGSVDTNEFGYATGVIEVKRTPRYAWDDIAPNFQFYVVPNLGAVSVEDDAIWHGFIEAPEIALTNWQAEGGASSRTPSSTRIHIAGYWNTAYFLPFRGSIAAGTRDAQIARLINAGYLPQLSSDTTGLSLAGTIGQPARRFETGNGGTDDMPVGDVIRALLSEGRASDNAALLPTVWNKRRLIIRAVSPTATPQFRIPGQNVNYQTKRSIMSVYDRVTVRYKLAGVLLRQSANDVTIANRLGVAYSPGAAVTPFARTLVTDIASQQGNSDTPTSVASAYASKVLNRVKVIRNESQSLIVKPGTSVKVVPSTAAFAGADGWSAVSYWQLMRAPGCWVQSWDVHQRLSDMGMTANEQHINSVFYITKASLDLTSGVITLTPENDASGQ